MKLWQPLTNIFKAFRNLTSEMEWNYCRISGLNILTCYKNMLNNKNNFNEKSTLFNFRFQTFSRNLWYNEFFINMIKRVLMFKYYRSLLPWFYAPHFRQLAEKDFNAFPMAIDLPLHHFELINSIKEFAARLQKYEGNRLTDFCND